MDEYFFDSSEAEQPGLCMFIFFPLLGSDVPDVFPLGCEENIPTTKGEKNILKNVSFVKNYMLFFGENCSFINFFPGTDGTTRFHQNSRYIFYVIGAHFLRIGISFLIVSQQETLVTRPRVGVKAFQCLYVFSVCPESRFKCVEPCLPPPQHFLMMLSLLSADLITSIGTQMHLYSKTDGDLL